MNLKVRKSYFSYLNPVNKNERDYSGKRKKLKNSAYTWNHSISEVINSLIEAGLKINYLHEFPFSREAHYSNMELKEDGWWFKNKEKIIPLMFSIKATKEWKK